MKELLEILNSYNLPFFQITKQKTAIEVVVDKMTDVNALLKDIDAALSSVAVKRIRIIIEVDESKNLKA